MRVFRVRQGSKGRAGRYRWVLWADFDRKLGFVPQAPTTPGQVNDAWSEALVAVDELGVAGVLRYDKYDDTDEMRAGGTWIRPDHRGKGLAGTLWKSALRGIKWVQVTTVSAGGRALVKSLKVKYPRVGWNQKRAA